MYKNYIALICLFILNITQVELYAKVNLPEREKTDYKDNLNQKKIPSNINKNLQNSFILLAENLDNQINRNEFNTIEVVSDYQYSDEKELKAEGNVYLTNKNMRLKSDKLNYNRENKLLIIEGNVFFKSGDQNIKASKIEYDIKNKTGYIYNVYGTINFDTLSKIASENDKDLDKNFLDADDKFIDEVYFNKSSSIGLQEINLGNENNSSPKIEFDLNEMQKWRFISKKIKIEDKLWTSRKLFITNDPFNEPQLLIENKNFSSLEDLEEILIKSEWTWIELDNILRIPVGPKQYTLNEKYDLRWELGYDKSNKDGLFFSRNYKPIISNNGKSILKLKQKYLLQRAINGKTNSFSAKNDSVLAEKISQDTVFLDYFGLEADLNSRIYDFDFNSRFETNSMDINKLNKIIQSKNELTKVLYEEEKYRKKKKTIFSIFGNYRDKVWNGSLGEIEILRAYGTKIQKKNYWIDNNVDKSSLISLIYGNYKSNKKNQNTQTISRNRLNLFLQRTHKYTIWEPKLNQKYITNEYKYSPNVIPYGLKFLVQTKADFYRYDDDNYQDLYSFKAGPELTLGNFKNKFLDYTKISVLPRSTISYGNSPFSFDQSNDNHGVELSVEQQIIGPISMKISTEYNLDINSNKYKDFYNNKFEIAWNRRAYNLSAYYIEDRQKGGINFKIHSFNFNGIGKTF